MVRLTATSKNQPLSSIEGKKSHCYKMNPLLALLRRGNQNSRNSAKKSQSNPISKSASSADNLDKTGGFEEKALPVALGRRGFSLERPLETAEKKKSASESNLLNASSDISVARKSPTPQTSAQIEDFPAPPNEDELQRMSVSATLETVAGGEGFYR